MSAASRPGLGRRDLLQAMLAASTALFTPEPTPGASAGDPAARKGRLETFPLESAVFGTTRTIRVYMPPEYGAAGPRYPVLYLNDGFAVFAERSWNAKAALDRLIPEQVIRPIVVVGIDNAASVRGVSDPGAARGREYLPYVDPSWPELRDVQGLRYPEFLLDEVAPAVERSFHISREPAERAVGGSSLGGVAALVAVLQRPAALGLLMLESTPLFLFDERLVDDTARLAVWPLTIYLGLGTAEAPDPEVLQKGQRAFNRLARVIAERSPRTRLLRNLEPGGTHTSAAWSRRLPTALTHLVPRAR